MSASLSGGKRARAKGRATQTGGREREGPAPRAGEEGGRTKKTKRVGRRSERGRGEGTVAHRHAIMWRLGLIYTRGRTETRSASPSESRARRGGRGGCPSVALLEGPDPNWRPATVSTGVPVIRIRVFRRGLRGIRNGKLFRGTGRTILRPRFPS